MGLGNSVFDGVLGVSITTTKFAPEVIKFAAIVLVWRTVYLK